MKTLLFTLPAGSTDYEVILGENTIEVFDYTTPKGFIFVSTDKDDFANVVRYQAEYHEYETITDLKKEVELNSENKDYICYIPDNYGVLPNLPTKGDVSVYWFKGETPEPYEGLIYSLDFSITFNGMYIGVL